MIRSSFLILVLICSLFISCENSVEESRLEQERSTIDSWVDSQSLPTVEFDEVFRLEIAPSPDADAELLLVGDSLYLNYAIYTFSTAPNALIDTNVEEIALNESADIAFMDFTPKQLLYGSSFVIQGLNMALGGSQQGATYGVVVPYRYAYGDSWNGVVEPYTTLYIEYEILKIIR